MTRKTITVPVFLSAGGPPRPRPGQGCLLAVRGYPGRDTPPDTWDATFTPCRQGRFPRTPQKLGQMSFAGQTDRFHGEPPLPCGPVTEATSTLLYRVERCILMNPANPSTPNDQRNNRVKTKKKR